MASVVPGARVTASCCVACFADATAVDVVATAATLGEIIADGLCMLLTTHVQRFSLSATFGVSL
jgi:hypothetical protein